MRVIIKGGVWKNTEDEILKAAVQKYGKNQWARISSLLTRKTPKQCKARWQDWLDPSIKKTEFSKLEDEKLLHLAKLMPTQWRTIAPIVGRTAAQCLERYQQLLDEAESNAAGEGSSAAAGGRDEATRRLRPGEIDPDPETKPPRPDPVDMDEDEKEMLSEARARLANTQGKKAKRKARERQLEEARRLAIMQKRRELKAAGIDFRGPGGLVRKKRKRGIEDYNKEIPFHKKPALGFFDTSEEIQRSATLAIRDKGKRRADGQREKTGSRELLSNLEGKRRGEIEEDARMADLRKRMQSDKNSNTVWMQVQHMEEPLQSKPELVLPAPQVSDNELAEIIKLGKSGMNVRRIVDTDMVESDTLRTPGMMMTPAPGRPSDSNRRQQPGSSRMSVSDNVRAEARNALRMENIQTPLLGGDNVPLSTEVGTGFEGVTPRGRMMATPSSTMPVAYGTPAGLRTPITALGATPGGARAKLSKKESEMLRNKLKMGLASLPKPRNDFEILMPDEAETESKDQAEELDKEEVFGPVDKDDLRRKQEKALGQRQAKLEQFQSTASKRGLPIPSKIPPVEVLMSTRILKKFTTDVRDNYKTHLRILLEQDVNGVAPELNADLSLDLEGARARIDAEARQLYGKRGPHPDDVEEILKVFAERDSMLVEDISHGTYTKPKNDAHRAQLLRTLAACKRDQLASAGQKAAKLSTRVETKFNGYLHKGNQLRQEMAQEYQTIEELRLQLHVYESARASEARTARTRTLQADVERVKALAKAEQDRYARLTNRRHDLRQQLETVISAKRGPSLTNGISHSE